MVEFTIDKSDFIKIINIKWYSSSNLYVRSYKNRKPIYLHRFIMSCPKNKVVDHINGDVLDNRKCNLRICTKKQNLQNRQLQKNNKSGFRGVYKNKKSWRAFVSLNGVTKHLGSFKTKKEAADNRDKAASTYYGMYANLNRKNPKKG